MSWYKQESATKTKSQPRLQQNWPYFPSGTLKMTLSKCAGRPVYNRGRYLSCAMWSLTLENCELFKPVIWFAIHELRNDDTNLLQCKIIWLFFSVKRSEMTNRNIKNSYDDIKLNKTCKGCLFAFAMSTMIIS